MKKIVKNVMKMFASIAIGFGIIFGFLWICGVIENHPALLYGTIVTAIAIRMLYKFNMFRFRHMNWNLITAIKIAIEAILCGWSLDQDNEFLVEKLSDSEEV